jgi:hypothetical protein
MTFVAPGGRAVLVLLAVTVLLGVACSRAYDGSADRAAWQSAAVGLPFSP